MKSSTQNVEVRKMMSIRKTLLNTLIVSVLTLAISAGIHTARAVTLVTPTCGMTLPTGDIQLFPASGTLGPCPANGLVIMAGAGTTSLDLNGWTIEGNYPSPNAFTIGILVSPGVSSVPIFSSTPGATVSHFEEGIDLLGASPCPAFGGNTVSGVGATVSGSFVPGFPLTLIANIRAGSTNGIGIHIGCSSSNIIENDMIAANGGLGIFIDNGASNKILSNFITHHLGFGSTLGGGAGIEIHIGPSTTIRGNNVVINTNGAYMDGFSSGGIIKGNVFSNNEFPCTGFGGATFSHCGYGFITNSNGNTIKGNTANFNGIDGIAVAGSMNSMKGNIASSNGLLVAGGGRGIALGNNCAGTLPGTPLLPATFGFATTGLNFVIGNTATSNPNANFFWDGILPVPVFLGNSGPLMSPPLPPFRIACPG